MNRNIWKYMAVTLLTVLVTALFLRQSEEVRAAWVLRDGTGR